MRPASKIYARKNNNSVKQIEEAIMANVNKADYTQRGEEPQIHDMMEDPIMKLLMKSDGVSIGALLPLIEQVSDKVQERSSAA